MILELVLQLLLQTIAKKKVLPWHIYTTHDGCGVQKKRGGGRVAREEDGGLGHPSNFYLPVGT